MIGQCDQRSDRSLPGFFFVFLGRPQTQAGLDGFLNCTSNARELPTREMRKRRRIRNLVPASLFSPPNLQLISAKAVLNIFSWIRWSKNSDAGELPRAGKPISNCAKNRLALLAGPFQEVIFTAAIESRGTLVFAARNKLRLLICDNCARSLRRRLATI